MIFLFLILSPSKGKSSLSALAPFKWSPPMRTSGCSYAHMVGNPTVPIHLTRLLTDSHPTYATLPLYIDFSLYLCGLLFLYEWNFFPTMWPFFPCVGTLVS